MFYASSYNQHNSDENEFALVHDDTEQSKRTARSTAMKPNKQLPEKAIRLMNAWYLAHEDNPYPNRNDLDYLATNGDIKESQVKAWFSNKRNRTQNTHPKRAKRYLVRNQTQQNSALWSVEPQKVHVADQLEQRAQLLQPQTYSIPSSPSPAAWSWLPAQSYDYYPHYYHHPQ